MIISLISAAFLSASSFPPAWILVLRYVSGQLPPNSAVTGQVQPMILTGMPGITNRHLRHRTLTMVAEIHQAQGMARAEAVGNHLPVTPMMTMIMTTTMTMGMTMGRRARRTRRRRRRATRSERVGPLPTLQALHRPAPQHPHPHHHHRRRHE